MMNIRSYAGIGSRKTPTSILLIMTKIARRLEALGWTLRSGGADGADCAFEIGVKDECNKEIFLPWKSFNSDTRSSLGLSEGFVIERNARAYDISKAFHPSYDSLSRSVKTIMARNVYQVLGESLDSPSSFIVCWTKDGKATGGTGQALRIADSYNIPIFNLFHEDAMGKLADHINSLK